MPIKDVLCKAVQVHGAINFYNVHALVRIEQFQRVCYVADVDILLHHVLDAEVLLPDLNDPAEHSAAVREEVQQDYEQCDKIVNSLNLTENMKIALECRMAGLSYPEIGRILERAQATVYEYFIKMRMRYQAIYG